MRTIGQDHHVLNIISLDHCSSRGIWNTVETFLVHIAEEPQRRNNAAACCGLGRTGLWKPRGTPNTFEAATLPQWHIATGRTCIRSFAWQSAVKTCSGCPVWAHFVSFQRILHHEVQPRSHFLSTKDSQGSPCSGRRLIYKLLSPGLCS